MLELGLVRDYVCEHAFNEHHLTAEDKPFFFNCNVATGSDQNHCFIFVTCVAMMKTLHHYGSKYVNHIDFTYKITEREFPLLVYGLSDIEGHFTPVAFALSSHERECDFTQFLDTLRSLSSRISTNEHPCFYKPSFVMMDACHASANAVEGGYNDF